MKLQHPVSQPLLVFGIFYIKVPKEESKIILQNKIHGLRLLKHKLQLRKGIL